jgi:enoyl-CoA hydratase
VITEHIHAAGIAELVLDAPPVNALNLKDIATLAAHLRSYADDQRVRVVVLRGAGRGFCGGGDVKEVQSLPGFDGILGQTHGSMELTTAIAECAVPVIGAVHGYCVGLGVLVAGVCDVLLAAPGTPFVLAEADNGAASGIIQAIGLMPEKRLRAALFTAEPVDAAELHAFGSVLRLVPAEELPAAARALAATIASKNPAVLRALKAATDESIGRDIRSVYRRELAHTLDLNLRGEAHGLRDDFVQGRRGSYLDAAPRPEDPR